MPLTSKTALLLLYGQGPPQQDMILVELSNIPRKQCGLEQDSWIPGNLIIDCFAGIRRKSDLLLHTYTGKDTSSMDEWRTRAWPCCRVPLWTIRKRPKIEMKQINSSSCTGVRFPKLERDNHFHEGHSLKDIFRKDDNLLPLTPNARSPLSLTVLL